MGYSEQLNGLTLAYIGDAVYEVFVRDHLIMSGLTKPNNLHQAAKRFVSAKAQAMIIQEMITAKFLTMDEEMIYKRGRNAKSHTSAKNTDVMTYRMATGFEAVIGYLHIEKKIDRLNDVLAWCVQMIGDRQREEK